MSWPRTISSVITTSFDISMVSPEPIHYPAYNTEISLLQQPFCVQAFSFNTQSSVVDRASCHQAGVGKMGQHSSMMCQMIEGTACL